MKIAIDQSNHIPWKGYFNLINDVDLFIFLTMYNMQPGIGVIEKIIITPNGEKWLTVPVGNNMHRLICDVSYLGRKWEYLYELDQYLTVEISRNFLGIKTEFADSRNFETNGVKHERLLSLVENVGGVSVYESGPAAKDYIIPEDYEARGIGLC